MAIENGVPILPITVNGTRFILPKGSIHLNPGTVNIIVHKPVSVDNYAVKRKKELIEKVRGMIESRLT